MKKEGLIKLSDLFDKQHLKELEASLFKEITLRTDSYDKLKAIADTIKKTPEITCENMINEFHKFLKEGGDL